MSKVKVKQDQSIHHDPTAFRIIGQRLVEMPIPLGFPMGLLDQQPSTPDPMGDIYPGPFGAPTWTPSPLLPSTNSCDSLEHWAIVENIYYGPQVFQRVIWKPTKLNIHGIVASGESLNPETIAEINRGAQKVRAEWRYYVAYRTVVKVGGTLAWRQNNPGNLRSAPTEIARFHGFAVFETLEDGRQAQRDLYLKTYGTWKVKDAIEKLTPPSENDTPRYLKDLKDQGVDLDKNVSSQIDTLMSAVKKNEGLIAGMDIPRCQ